MAPFLTHRAPHDRASASIFFFKVDCGSHFGKPTVSDWPRHTQTSRCERGGRVLGPLFPRRFSGLNSPKRHLGKIQTHSSPVIWSTSYGTRDGSAGRRCQAFIPLLPSLNSVVQVRSGRAIQSSITSLRPIYGGISCKYSDPFVR